MANEPVSQIGAPTATVKTMAYMKKDKIMFASPASAVRRRKDDQVEIATVVTSIKKKATTAIQALKSSVRPNRVSPDFQYSTRVPIPPKPRTARVNSSGRRKRHEYLDATDLIKYSIETNHLACQFMTSPFFNDFIVKARKSLT